MAAMKTFAGRLAGLEDRLAATDFARYPRQRKWSDLTGARGGLTDEEMEKFVAPGMRPSGPNDRRNSSVNCNRSTQSGQPM